MKKLITGILALLSCFAFAAGCTDDDSSSSLSTDTNTESSDTNSGDEQDDPLTAAKDVLYAQMLDDSNKSTRKNYTVKNTYYSFHVEKDLTVTVSVDVTEGVTVEAGETDWTVKIDQALENDLAYVLTVTISDGESSVSFNLNRTALKAPSVVPQEITEKPVEEKAYKLYMYQVTKNADEYFNGSLDKTGFYLNTSLSREYATDVYVDYVEGSETNFNIYFYEGEVKQYIGVYNSYNDKGYHLTPTFNPEINNFEHITSKTDWATSNTFFTGSYVFTWSETYGTFVTTLANAKYDESTSKDPATITPASVTAFLGTSGTYYTFGGMNVTEIENEDTCVGKLVEMVDKSAIPAETKLEKELETLQLTTQYKNAATVTLPTAGTTYPDVAIAWAIEENAIATLDGNTLTIVAPIEVASVKLTATLTVGEAEETKEFTFEFAPAINAVTAPEANTAYRMYIDQIAKDNVYFATGSISSGKFLATTVDGVLSADVYAEAADAGYKFYFLNGVAKNYINIVEYLDGESTKCKVELSTESGCVYVYNAEKKAWVTTVGTTEYYLGTYSTFNTISASKASYITAENTGVSQFPANLVSLADAADDRELNTYSSYKASLTNTANTYYVTGAVSGNYLATSIDPAEAVEIKAEAAEGGFKFYFMDGETKNYINIEEYQSGKAKIVLSTEVGCVYAYNAETKSWFTTAGENDYYLGTYSTYTTVSASKTSYIDAETTGVSQFPLQVNFAEAVDALTPTDAERVAFEKEALELEVAEVTGDKQITLASKGSSYGLVSIAWAVEHANASIVDGKLVLKAVEADTTVTVTATLTAGEVVETKELTIALKAPVAGQTTVAVVIADYADTNSWANGTKYTTITMDEVISVTATGGSNTGKYYTSGEQWRIYQTETPSVTIEAGTGKSIVSVKISYAISNTGILTQGETNIESDTVVTVNASSVTFGVGNTGTATNGQVKITAIEVIYA